MTPFSMAVTQLPGIRLIILDYFYHERDSSLFLLEQTLILDTDLPSIHAILHSQAPDPGTHFITNEVLQWADAYGISGLVYSLPS